MRGSVAAGAAAAGLLWTSSGSSEAFARIVDGNQSRSFEAVFKCRRTVGGAFWVLAGPIAGDEKTRLRKGRPRWVYDGALV